MAYHLDFETRSILQPKDVGQVAYARHPTTDVLVIAAARDDDDVIAVDQFSWLTRRDPWPAGAAALLETLIYSQEPIYAHNAAFETAIWEHVLHRRYGWPAIDPNRWRCTAAIASTYGLPRSLEQVAICLEMAERKDEDGHRLMVKMSKPRKVTKGEDVSSGEVLWHEGPEDLARLTEYCRQDVVVEREIHHRLGDLPERELKVWQLDQRINRKGVPVDLDLCRGALAIKGEIQERNNAELRELCGTPEEGSKTLPERTSQVQRLLAWARSRGWELPDLAKETIEEVLEAGLKSLFRSNRGPPQGSVRRVLELRLANSRASTAKYMAALDRHVSYDHGVQRVHDSLLYGGAHTLRWSGKGVQTQNMPRGTIKPRLYEYACSLVSAADMRSLELLWGDPMSVLRSCVRGIIRAPEGKAFVVCDFAAIEARGLFWLAGEEKGVQLFRDKDAALSDLEPYLWMAGRIYGRDPQEIHDDRKAKCPVAEEQRYFGKQAILGCGYGMGAKKFLDMYGGTKELAKASVAAYREGFPAVPALWQEVDDAALAAVRGTKKPIPTCGGRVLWGMKDGYLCARLPSGRFLHYPKPRIGEVTKTIETIDGEERTFTRTALSHMTTENGKWRRRWTWGGTLTENVVQAVARDLLADALVRIDETPDWEDSIITHAHDEAVCEVPDEGTEANERRTSELERIMCILPEWAKGCPIDAEAWCGPRYRK